MINDRNLTFKDIGCGHQPIGEWLEHQISNAGGSWVWFLVNILFDIQGNFLLSSIYTQKLKLLSSISACSNKILVFHGKQEKIFLQKEVGWQKQDITGIVGSFKLHFTVIVLIYSWMYC